MPDNAIYYKAAYTATATIFALYSLFLWLRVRRVHEQLDATATAIVPARTVDD